MSQTGARGPVMPPRAPAPLAPKVASPVAPPVVAKPVGQGSRPRLESNAAMSPGGAKVLVAAPVSAPDVDDDDAWGEPATKIEPAVHRREPLPAAVAPSASDLHAIVKAAVDEALGPVGEAFLRLERRVAELERHPATSVVGGPATGPVALATAIPAPRPSAYVPRAPDLPIEPLSALDAATPFDGKRRRRRVVLTFVLVVLVALGTPLGILIASYMR